MTEGVSFENDTSNNKESLQGWLSCYRLLVDALSSHMVINMVTDDYDDVDVNDASCAALMLKLLHATTGAVNSLIRGHHQELEKASVSIAVCL